ncbi:MAG TPA: VOC family protein [Chitinivibrionales bacterium]|jgi:catechol 2,3-dioxygenase-like lactoylglutathione lyase family enzyme|nr:VOC family protein [Chitinivibrionales bacterium]
MQLKFFSITVDNQDKALRFYTTVLGFKKMADLPMGQLRWLTVISPDGINGVELVLESVSFPPSQKYQKARFDAGIPSLALITNDIHADFNRLKKLGVIFRGEPKNMGLITAVLFEDTCGNLINLVQAAPPRP